MNHGHNPIGNIIIFIILISFSLSPESFGDDNLRKNKVGLSAAIQKSQLDITVPVWIGANNVILPSIYAIYSEDIAGEVGIGIGYRSNFNNKKAIPYAGFRIGALILMPKGGDSRTDLIAGPFFGGEYFIGDEFSAGVEAQINVSKSQKNSFRFGNPDNININTATLVYVTFYFK